MVRLYSFFLKLLFYLVLEEGTEKEDEKCQCARDTLTPTRDLACNPGMCPKWDLNQQSFSFQASAQLTPLSHNSQDSLFFFFILYSIVYMYHIFFTHWPINGHVDCFHILAIVNNVAVKIGVHIAFRK